MPTVAALFVDPNGPYVGQANVDPWDEARDARRYLGVFPVVAHPPCERWGRFAEGSPTHKRFKLGDDGGCFESALYSVRTWGGVIEHPQGSHAWRTFGLPIPEGRGWTVQDRFGGRSCYIDQGAYGHPAKKPTWLYAVLPHYPKLNWTRVWGRPYIGGDGFHSSAERARAKATGKWVPKEQIPTELNHITPEAFRDQLLDMARSCYGWLPKVKHTQASVIEARRDD